MGGPKVIQPIASSSLLARPKSPMRRQGSVKRSRSQHFFSQMELDKINGDQPVSTEKPSIPQKQQFLNNNSKPTPPAVKEKKPVGPKPPMVQVMGVLPNLKPLQIKVFVETIPDVSYVLNVANSKGEDIAEFDDPSKIVYTKVIAGQSYRVKLAAKSINGVVGDWSEAEPVKIPSSKETVVVLGGDVEYEENLNVTEYYVDKEKCWRVQPEFNLTTERTRLGGTVWNGNVVIIGGSQRGEGHTNQVEKYDFNNKRWSPMSGTKFVRHSHKVGVVDGKLFVID